jgi:hypothetical protein
VRQDNAAPAFAAVAVHRKMYVVIYWGALRRRIRRVRLRVFTNVRTATRNLDLPLAIRDSPIACQPFRTDTGGLGPVRGSNMAAFSASAFFPCALPLNR